MAVLDQILKGLEKGRETYDTIRGSIDRKEEIAGQSEKPAVVKSVLAFGDNVDLMKKLISEGYAGQFRMIYIDPPFFTKSKFNASVNITGSDGSRHRVRHLAFDDRFERSLEYYIENMTVRIMLMRFRKEAFFKEA